MSRADSAPVRITLISTGGTIEKTYDELKGILRNEVPVLDVMLAGLEIEDLVITRVSLMNKDSLEMVEADHETIARAALDAASDADAVVVTHGTDRLTRSGCAIHAAAVAAGGTPVPIILTGAMRPYELRRTDAVQNLTEALFAARVLPAGVWCVLHNRAIEFPGVRKDYDRMTFVPDEVAEP